MPTASINAAIQIVPWRKVDDPGHYTEELNAIFFGASATKSFDSDAIRDAFRYRWLGQYLEHDPQWAYLAIIPDGTLAGYIVGCTQDPARSQRFADISYFKTLSELTARYPAHLHINLAPQFRNHGIGAQLIDALIADLEAAGIKGVHVVTGATSKSVPFYNRNHFLERGEPGAAGKGNVFLARDLAVQKESNRGEC